MKALKIRAKSRNYRTAGFCIALKHELEDLEDSWDFAMKVNLDFDSVDETNPELKEAGLRVKEMTSEDLDLVNNAIKSHIVCVQELKKRVEVSDGRHPSSAVSEIIIRSTSSTWPSQQPSVAGGRGGSLRTRPTRTSPGLQPRRSLRRRR